MILLAVLALATVAPVLTGANAQTAYTKLALGNLVTASERKTTWALDDSLAGAAGLYWLLSFKPAHQVSQSPVLYQSSGNQ